MRICACMRAHKYTYGRSFTLTTTHTHTHIHARANACAMMVKGSVVKGQGEKTGRRWRQDQSGAAKGGGCRNGSLNFSNN